MREKEKNRKGKNKISFFFSCAPSTRNNNSRQQQKQLESYAIYYWNEKCNKHTLHRSECELSVHEDRARATDKNSVKWSRRAPRSCHAQSVKLRMKSATD